MTLTLVQVENDGTHSVVSSGDSSLLIFFLLLNSYFFGSSQTEVFLGESVLELCSRFRGEHPCRSAISMKLLCNFVEIALWDGCSPMGLLHIFGMPSPENTSG